ncbi:MAG TPA: tyrosinase family protein [Solirubrobacterales bacterium]|nr:tyrosinase family protein [Solirubrobacterales bacterium]
MKERSPEEVTSWEYQAAIHGSTEAPKPLYDQCKHGSWFFLPWHRMYLYYFEQIVRAAVVELEGPEDWSLPYWNYGLDEEHASIPDAFREPEVEGEPNPLFVEQRAPRTEFEPGINEGAVLKARTTSDASATAAPNFVGPEEFGGGPNPPTRTFFGEAGQLELSPHNAVHGAVGGEEGWMSFPSEAAKDPIFWLHHANIDRIWAEWEQNHQDAPQPEWRDESFPLFNPEGEEESKTPAEVLDTIADLNYTYDVIPAQGEEPGPEPTPPEPEPEMVGAAATPNVSGGGGEMAEMPSPDRKVVGAAEEKVTLTGSTEAVPVTIDDRAKEELQEASRKSDPRRVFLNIEDIRGEINPGTVYGVYLNLPDDPDEPTLEEHFAGNISFFGIERAREPRGDEHGHSMRYVLEIAGLLRELGGGEYSGDSELDVTFRPLRLKAPEGHPEEESFPAHPDGIQRPPIEIGRVSLSVG